ncbi:MAG: hypothetical protein ACO2ZM_05450 [Francisellaceae bacterium]
MATWVEFEKQLKSDNDLKQQFIKSPAATLKEHGINPEDLPENVAKKIAGAGVWSDITSGANSVLSGMTSTTASNGGADASGMSSF